MHACLKGQFKKEKKQPSHQSVLPKQKDNPWVCHSTCHIATDASLALSDPHTCSAGAAPLPYLLPAAYLLFPTVHNAMVSKGIFRAYADILHIPSPLHTLTLLESPPKELQRPFLTLVMWPWSNCHILCPSFKWWLTHEKDYVTH